MKQLSWGSSTLGALFLVEITKAIAHAIFFVYITNGSNKNKRERYTAEDSDIRRDCVCSVGYDEYSHVHTKKRLFSSDLVKKSETVDSSWLFHNLTVGRS